MALYFLPMSGGPPVPPPPSAAFFGDPNTNITAINTNGLIQMSRSSGNIPAFVHVSANAITATGSVLDVQGNAIATAALRPYERLEYRWDFGDPNGTEIFTNPQTGLLVNANTDQIGPEAVYVYRNVGFYTIRLTARGKRGNVFTTATTIATFQANSIASWTNYYFDSNAPDDTGDGSAGNPWKNLFGHGAIAPNGSVSGTNIVLNLANGSVWSAAAGTAAANCLQNVHNCTHFRIAAWNNPARPSIVKPVIESTSLGACIASSNNLGYSDHVYSSVVCRQAATTTTNNFAITFLSPKGNRTSTTVRGTISNGSGGPGNALNSSHIYANSNAGVNGNTVFSTNGTVAAGTTIVSGGSGTFVVSGAAQNTAADDMIIIPTSQCAAFTGTIASNILTISAPPGYASLTDVSTTSLATGTGAKVLTVSAGKGFISGQGILIYENAAPNTNTMSGTVTSYSGTTLVVNATSKTGSGTFSDWLITECGLPQPGQLILASISSVGSYRTIGSSIDGTHWNVSADIDSPTPQLMVCGPGGQPVTDLYLDNVDTVCLANQANGVAVTNATDNPSLTDTSTTPLTIALGSQTLTVSAGKAFAPTQAISIIETSAPSTNTMQGTVTSYSGTTLVVNVTSKTGSGTFSDWTVTESKIRIFVASTSIFIASHVYSAAGIQGATQANGLFVVTAVGANYIDTNLSSVGLGTYTGGGSVWAQVAGGVDWGIASNGIFDPKSFYQRTCQWGGSVTCINNVSGAGVAFGAAQWTSYVGVTVQVTGPNISGADKIHQMNPETCCNNILCRWVSTSAGPSNINSGLNFAFEPRCYAGFTGVIAADPVGGSLCIADNFFSYAQNGVAGGVQNNTNPGFGIGWYDGVVIERNSFGWITNPAVLLTGTKNVTVRFNNAWQVGALFYTGSAGSPIDGLGGYLSAAIYSNKVYRPSAANQGLYGFGSINNIAVFTLQDGTTYNVLPQQFVSNIIWDDRTAPEIVNLGFSGLLATGSIVDLNQYYTPNAPGAPLSAYMLNNNTANTLAQWKNVSPPLYFDPNAVYLPSGPGWHDPAHGNFNVP